MTHGYMLSGSGSFVYVQNLCRALVRLGHEVNLLCQEPEPLAYDFVNEHLTVDGSDIEHKGERKTQYPGRCSVYNPEIGGLLPVYVYDDYPGWRVKTFLDLTEGELENYLETNTTAVRTVLRRTEASAVVTNHSVPGPLIAQRALEGSGVSYTSIVHGSCLQYLSRRSEKYMSLTRNGLAGAHRILALSAHSAGTIAEDFPDMAHKTLALPGGVDTGLFRPDSFDPDALEDLNGGPGRGPEQARALQKARSRSTNADELAVALRGVSASYDARAHDRDAGYRLAATLADDSPLVMYVGKLIHSKGVHSLISAFSHIHRKTGARLLVVGYGTFRDALEALTQALGTGDEKTLRLLADNGPLFEDREAEQMEHFTLSDDLLRSSTGLNDAVEFVGPLYHADLAKILPAMDVAAVPSIFPETFGLVAAEFAAAGVPAFVAKHSGLMEAGGIIGQNLSFDLRVSMDDFERNLAHAITEYLSLSENERQRSREIVRWNSVDHLSWETLASDLVGISRGEE